MLLILPFSGLKINGEMIMLAKEFLKDVLEPFSIWKIDQLAKGVKFLYMSEDEVEPSCPTRPQINLT